MNRTKSPSFWVAVVLSQLLFAALLPISFKLLAYLHPVFLLVIWMCVTLFVFFAVYFVQKEQFHIPKLILKIAMATYSFGLVVLLFFRPGNQEYSQINLVPFRTIAGFLAGDGNFLVAFYNIAANILLFVPYGVSALMLRKNPSRTRLILIPVAVILLIEIMQFLTRRGSMDIDDLILNLFGVGVGYLLYPLICKVIKIVDKN